MRKAGEVMSKRFIDTGLWPKRWFRELPPAEKLAWLYVLTNCDAVGVWDADLKLAEFSIGATVNWEELRAAANGNIEELPNGKWWVVDFIQYQYGSVKKVSSSRVQQHLSSLLLKHGLEERYFATVAPTVKDKDKDKDIDKDKDKIKSEVAPGVLLTTSEHDKLVTKYGADNTKAAYAKLSAYKLQSGKHYASDYGAILHWVMDEVVKKVKGEGPRTATPGWECAKCHRVNHNTGGVCLCGEVREVPA